VSRVTPEPAGHGETKAPPAASGDRHDARLVNSPHLRAMHPCRSSVASALFLLIVVTAACHNGNGRATSDSTTAAHDTLFFDDFSGNTVDRSKWTVIVPAWDVNDELQAYVDSSATMYIAHGAESDGAPNGALVIRAVHRPGFRKPGGKRFDFLSGRMDTQHKAEFTYGTIAARIKLTAGSGLWPAFWALGDGDWPQTGEIDVMENVGERSWVSSAMHGGGYFGDTPIGKRHYFAPPADIEGWHVYSVDWHPYEIDFKVDGVSRYRVTRGAIQHYGPWAFDNPKYIIVNMAIGGGYPNGVNRTTSPYFGLPASTVGQIDAGRAKMLVDWVLVTAD
jgi:beta-glucanase (GH16 family)